MIQTKPLPSRDTIRGLRFTMIAQLADGTFLVHDSFGPLCVCTEPSDLAQVLAWQTELGGPGAKPGWNFVEHGARAHIAPETLAEQRRLREEALSGKIPDGGKATSGEDLLAMLGL